MPANNYPSLFVGVSDKRRSGYETAIALLEDGLAKGQIANAVYENDVKFLLVRGVEHAWRKVVQDTFRYQEAGEAERNLHHDLPYSPELRRFDRYIAIIDKSAIDTDYSRTVRAFLMELKPLAEGVVALKAMAVKRKPKDISERKPTYTAPKTSSAAEAAILETLRAVTEPQYEPIRAMYLSHYTQAFDAFMAAAPTRRKPVRGVASSEFLDPHGFFIGDDRPTRVVGSGENARTLQVPEDHGAYFVVRDCVERTNYHEPYRAKADAAARIEKAATEIADAIRTAFITKNMFKLVAITEAKGNFEKIEPIPYREPDLMGMNGAFRLTFADSSSFEVNMKVVHHYSNRGTPFQRIPVTFHNVVLPNGERMKQPSEKRMNEVFAVKAA